MKAAAAAILLLGAAGGARAHGDGGGVAEGKPQALCPTDPAVSPACAAAIYPPFPICLKKTAKGWVEHAKDAATRCCGEDISSCQCPVKDGPAFQGKIKGYCNAVQEGGACEAKGPGGAEGNSLLRGFDWEQQVQREELAP